MIIKPGLNEIKILLDQVKHGPHRELDLVNIAGIGLFANKPDTAIQFEVSNIYLKQSE